MISNSHLFCVKAWVAVLKPACKTHLMKSSKNVLILWDSYRQFKLSRFLIRFLISMKEI